MPSTPTSVKTPIRPEAPGQAPSAGVVRPCLALLLPRCSLLILNPGSGAGLRKEQGFPAGNSHSQPHNQGQERGLLPLPTAANSGCPKDHFSLHSMKQRESVIPKKEAGKH